jgi:transposase
MRSVGLDIHKRVVQAVILDDQGHLSYRDRFPCDQDALLSFARNRLDKDTRVAMEATTNTWAIVDLLEPFVAEVVVSNPMCTKAIASAKVKTDKVDATTLAQLLRCDYLPQVWQPGPPLRQLRSLTSRRASLTHHQTAIKNRIHSVLHQRLMAGPERLFDSKGLDWLRKVVLDPPGRAAIDSDLRLLEAHEAELEALDKDIAQRGCQDHRVKLLLTLPGVGIAVAQTLLAALGDPSRFPDGDHAASYIGLVPSTRQSADHCYHGPITKHGCAHARWVMVEAAQHLDDHPGPLGGFFRRISAKKGRNKAVVATARKLVVIAWHMLMKNEPYRYAKPATTKAKLVQLRTTGGGGRRRGGVPPGSLKSQPTGQGSTRLIPSLAEVYASEGIPMPTMAPGEQRTIKQAGAEGFVETIQTSRRVPRKRSTAS